MSNKPVPRPTPETAPFWEGCAHQELRLQHCEDCGHVQYPPRKLCSGCFSTAVAWQVASGRGVVRSWSTVVMPGAPGFADEVPYVSALIRLDEGPTMLSVLRNCATDEIEFGAPVEVIFEKRSEEISIPYFQLLPG
jgi:uncharacterized OB-fold protein